MESLNIRHFKLMNGEEIIGLLAIKNDNNYIIERPVRIHPSLLGGVQFSAWFPFSESKQFKVLKSSIIQHVPIAESIKDTYVQFALKMDKPITPPDTRTDEELLKEYKDSFGSSADDLIPETKRTLH